MAKKITYADTGKPAEKPNAEYLRRNLLHCKAVGVAAGIEAVLNRLYTQTRAPQWLLKILVTEWRKAEAVAEEMGVHRDEVSRTS